jgi:hypothetical protein
VPVANVLEREKATCLLTHSLTAEIVLDIHIEVGDKGCELPRVA